MLWWPPMNLGLSFMFLKEQVSSSRTELFSKLFPYYIRFDIWQSVCLRQFRVSILSLSCQSFGVCAVVSDLCLLISMKSVLQYQVFSHPMGHYSVYDFYEVASIRGVYISTVVDPGLWASGTCWKCSNWNCADLKGHVSKITFDNGGMWSGLSAPKQLCVSVYVCYTVGTLFCPLLSGCPPLRG